MTNAEPPQPDYARNMRVVGYSDQGAFGRRADHGSGWIRSHRADVLQWLFRRWRTRPAKPEDRQLCRGAWNPEHPPAGAWRPPPRDRRQESILGSDNQLEADVGPFLSSSRARIGWSARGPISYRNVGAVERGFAIACPMGDVPRNVENRRAALLAVSR